MKRLNNQIAMPVRIENGSSASRFSIQRSSPRPRSNSQYAKDSPVSTRISAGIAARLDAQVLDKPGNRRVTGNSGKPPKTRTKHS
jgi:hypothetical protein